jgi:prepilin-type N-terminal cleavage/methylation domain-containing protein
MNSTPIRQRRGFTLSEMLVVLGILVVITAVAQPAIRATLSDNRLRSAGRQVRIELAKARLKAVQSGVAQRFRYQLGKNRFEVVPLSAHEAGTTERGAQGGAFSAGHDDAAASLVETVDDAATNDTCEQSLPDGVCFADDCAASPLDPAPTEMAGENGEGWSTPIVFYPNGRTADAQIKLKGERNAVVEVSLRGLTGAATASKPRQEVR